MFRMDYRTTRPGTPRQTQGELIDWGATVQMPADVSHTVPRVCCAILPPLAGPLRPSGTRLGSDSFARLSDCGSGIGARPTTDPSVIWICSVSLEAPRIPYPSANPRTRRLLTRRAFCIFSLDFLLPHAETVRRSWGFSQRYWRFFVNLESGPVSLRKRRRTRTVSLPRRMYPMGSVGDMSSAV